MNAMFFQAIDLGAGIDSLVQFIFQLMIFQANDLGGPFPLVSFEIN